MGLFIAKEYIRNEKIIEDKRIPLDYKGNIQLLKKNEHFICADDEFLEFEYTGDELKISYGNEDRLMVNNINGTLSFTVIEAYEPSKGRQHITYPLTMPFSAIEVVIYSEKEYEQTRGVIM